jgi:hypothetical protein
MNPAPFIATALIPPPIIPTCSYEPLGFFGIIWKLFWMTGAAVITMGLLIGTATLIFKIIGWFIDRKESSDD